MITDQALLTIADKLGIAATEIFSIMVAGQKWQALSTFLFALGILFCALAVMILVIGGEEVSFGGKMYSPEEAAWFFKFVVVGILLIILSSVVLKIFAPEYAALKELLGMVVQN